MTLYQNAILIIHENEPISTDDLRKMLLPLCANERICVQTINQLLDSTAIERSEGMFRIRRV